MYSKDFAHKKFKKRSNKSVKKFGFLLLSLMLVFGFGLRFSAYIVGYKDYVVRLYAPQAPKNWLFVDSRGNDQIRPVRGGFGLRWMKNTTKVDCEKIALRLKKVDLPVVWVNGPKEVVGLCRFDIGPFRGVKQAFDAKGVLYFSGFYGKVKVVNWLG